MEKLNLGFIIQVDTLCHKLPNFIEKARAPACGECLSDWKTSTRTISLGAKKRQNKITEYRKMLIAWKRARVITYAGYILGFPNDTVESILHDIDVIKRELPVDLLEFFYLTPLPGSEDHLKLHRAGVPLDADLNRYDLNHTCTAHPLMSRADWEHAYRLAWERYYTTEHIETVLKRVASAGANASNALFLITWFKGSIDYENIHPLESGFLRRKFRRDRRPGFAVEPVWQFYPEILRRDRGETGALVHAVSAAASHLSADQARPEPLRLYRSGHERSCRRRSGNAGIARHGRRARLCEQRTAAAENTRRSNRAGLSRHGFPRP